MIGWVVTGLKVVDGVGVITGELTPGELTPVGVVTVEGLVPTGGEEILV